MKFKFLSVLLAVVAVVGGVAVSAPSAEAACSYNGYMHSGGRCANSYENKHKYEFATNKSNIVTTAYLEQYIRQLQALLIQLQALQNNTSGGGYGASDVDVVTQGANDLNGEEATLRGQIDFNSEDEATVYFRWGTSAAALNKETTNVILEEDEDDESFEATITNLDSNKTYYFRAVAEDESGDRDYGAIMSFRSDDNDEDNNSSTEDEPSVETDDALQITTNSAKLFGSVDMNDFNNGEVFFAYGEDEDQVRDIADDFDSYDEVDEDSEDLQKISVDGNLDEEKSYWATMTGLDDDTEIFYVLCVSYEDEDGDEVIVCGDTESFTTKQN